MGWHVIRGDFPIIGLSVVSTVLAVCWRRFCCREVSTNTFRNVEVFRPEPLTLLILFGGMPAVCILFSASVIVAGPLCHLGSSIFRTHWSMCVNVVEFSRIGNGFGTYLLQSGYGLLQLIAASFSIPLLSSWLALQIEDGAVFLAFLVGYWPLVVSAAILFCKRRNSQGWLLVLGVLFWLQWWPLVPIVYLSAPSFSVRAEIVRGCY